MKKLCNEVCPRDLEGNMLGERSVGGEKRPAWCLAKIMHDMGRAFDASDLKFVEPKAIRFMAHTARISKRLRNLTEHNRANMKAVDKAGNETLKNEIKSSFESWRKSLYGYCWLTQGMRRQPTKEELHVISERIYDAMTASLPTS